MSRKSIKQITTREARANDQVKIRTSAARQYASRYSHRIGTVARKVTDKKTNTKVCMVSFPNRIKELAINTSDLIIVESK